MPEGDTIHGYAIELRQRLARRKIHATSPQGRFVDGATTLDGKTVKSTEALGKHLLVHFAESTLHVHLGRIGRFRRHEGKPADVPAPTPGVRLRLQASNITYDLSGPTRCEIASQAALETLLHRIGPDLLNPKAKLGDVAKHIVKSKRSIAAQLMDQTIISGIGNIYRCEILYEHKLHPQTAGNAIEQREVLRMLKRCQTWMAASVKRDEQRTTPIKLGKRRFIVFRQKQDLLSHEVTSMTIANRRVWWCPAIQTRRPEG